MAFRRTMNQSNSACSLISGHSTHTSGIRSRKLIRKRTAFIVFGLGLLAYTVFYIVSNISGGSVTSPRIADVALPVPNRQGAFRWSNAQGVHAKKAFNGKWATTLKKLGLLNVTMDENEKFEPANMEEQKTIIVTGLSNNHFLDAMEMLKTVQKYEKNLTYPPLVFMYDIGLSDARRYQLRQNFKFLEIRQFPFDKYPKYVANLFEYRWKPLMIAEFLATSQYKNFWWLDSSVRIRNDGDLRWYYRDYVESGGNWKVQYPLILNHYTSHSIFAATHPNIYDYFPVDESLAKATPMYGGGVGGVFRRGLVVKNVLKWWVLCALELGCMAPAGSDRFGCSFGSGERRNTVYAGCHRFDQSVISILVADANDYNISRYAREKPMAESAIVVERLQ